MKRPALHYVNSPKQLPAPPKQGRVVTLDLAFAAEDRYERATRPFIEALGDRLAAWIDHHPHPAWSAYAGDPRFVLVDKATAPACPQLVTPERIAAIGEIDHLFAHADFDGWLSTVKYLNGGSEPWPGADEDARAIDAPGQGFRCSARGQRIADAVARSRDAAPTKHEALLRELAEALLGGEIPQPLQHKIDSLAGELRARRASLESLLEQAEDDHPGILVLSLQKMISPGDKKFLLQTLEERATIGVVEEPTSVTVATFDGRIRLTTVPALHGTDGFAWGKARYDAIRDDLIGLLEGET
ncbi:hypothetical protein [Vulgatibacter sp.]|uniref:hypothetical protein n=1 Tax=Vulgatibacter sp. TaxID=1971226 RepID=UPI0035685B22